MRAVDHLTSRAWLLGTLLSRCAAAPEALGGSHEQVFARQGTWLTLFLANKQDIGIERRCAVDRIQRQAEQIQQQRQGNKKWQ